jgi:hypothetical protein
LRVPGLFFDLRFVGPKVVADYAEFSRQNQDRTVVGEALIPAQPAQLSS